MNGGTMEAKISVVIPTHMRAESLHRALNSVLAQTYPVEEIIVVSDGLDFATDTLMKALIAHNSKIKYYVVDPPQGGNHARNIGIKHTSHDYIAFLDDDDAWCSNKIALQLEAMKADQRIGLVCAASKIVDKDEKLNRINIPSVGSDSHIQILNGNSIGTTSSVLTTRQVIEKSGVFDESLKALQDYELWIRICQVTKTSVVREPCLIYYDDPASDQISRSTQKYIDAYEEIFRKHQNLFLSYMSAEEFRLRKADSLLAISRRAKRNGQSNLARKYAFMALCPGKIIGAIKAYLITFVPMNILSSLQKRYRSSLIRKERQA